MSALREEVRLAGRPVFSHAADAVRCDRLLFVAGVLPADADGRLVGGEDVVAQTRHVIDELGAILAAGGCAGTDLVKLNVYLTDIAELPLVRTLPAEVLGAARTAATVVEVPRLAVPGARVEVDAVALVPR